MQVESTIQLKPAEVQRIIADYINTNFQVQTPVMPAQVKFTVTAGYSDMREYQAPGLTGCEVKITIGTKNNTGNSNGQVWA